MTDANSNEPDPIDDIDADDWADLMSAGLDPDTVRSIMAMHATLHKDGDVIVAPGICEAVGHSWSDMIERHTKLETTPQLDPAEIVTEEVVPAVPQVPGYRMNPDGTIPVEGHCPACGQGTLAIGALASSGLRSQAIVCQNIECVSPMTANRLLNLRARQRMTVQPVETIELPQTFVATDNDEPLDEQHDGDPGIDFDHPDEV